MAKYRGKTSLIDVYWPLYTGLCILASGLWSLYHWPLVSVPLAPGLWPLYHWPPGLCITGLLASWPLYHWPPGPVPIAVWLWPCTYSCLALSGPVWPCKPRPPPMGYPVAPYWSLYHPDPGTTPPTIPLWLVLY